MLVLTRRLAQEIVIDENIRITIVAVSGNTVRIGITAPQSVRVDRRELRERIEANADLPLVVDGGHALSAR